MNIENNMNTKHQTEYIYIFLFYCCTIVVQWIFLLIASDAIMDYEVNTFLTVLSES